ncbi:hypothetical protein RJZ56_004790 [Blastomyces dermatitidis]|uniref:CSN8/PSMD8/EIF3K domain-containing protein n=3 Tax=Blastomyces TaxID=229219 RepID=A0A179UGI2_BLAGS|nr:uncharacterized protein BDBG_01977 [Blastomyces gilchristii SLH14081]XP_045275592.1 proteasome regulatory particle lid subunit RPN12 [Blastomyces dermatitidis ER-3]EGE77370.1 26S proteasome non-ATPase regulatory subunit 8 [Blastomyces dermatitidis ATCC 18188]EQL38535.1 hypothetical protein BDFG_00119 [Blastomyces dermatitidis ATCC 26199]EEQ88464.1 hypothetical protein BDCG_03584 [Blastomyces dermatitidis ER-3]OAT05612.1 hypothetical protein BDBG_01977 [Blastomyces gilchristii SLH14081]
MPDKDLGELLDLIAAFKSNLQRKQFNQAEKLVQKTAPILHKLGAFSLTTSIDDKLFCLAREALELSAITSLHLREDDPRNQALFTTSYKLLKPFYDREQALQMAKDPALERLNPSASQRNKITALYLVYLLSEGNITEFDTVLAGLRDVDEDSVKNDPMLKYPIDLAASMTDGRYNVAWEQLKQQARKKGNSEALSGQAKLPEEFEIFSPVLLSTIRMWMAASAEKAYESLSISSAKDVLKLDSEGDVVEFAESRDWILRDGRIYFPQSEAEQVQGSEKSASRASRSIIENGIGYAQQLGTIV